ncbi:MAG: HAD-IB family hydrolase [Chloroflexota bacterium]|nr:HAD-IB family hydrolase [Chloroflexota bacterium]
MPRIAFFDIDGTLITESVWDYFLMQPEIAPHKRAVYMRFLPTFIGRKLGILDEARFREAWVQQMARLMRGWSQAQVNALFDRVVTAMGSPFRSDVSARVREHLAQGERVVLASGMFDGFAQRFAQQLGAEAGLGTKLGFRDGLCTGKIDGRGCAGEQKPEFLRAFLQSRDLSSAYGYADSFSDVPMLAAVGTPVATYPDDQLRAYARAQGWAIFPA